MSGSTTLRFAQDTPLQIGGKVSIEPIAIDLTVRFDFSGFQAALIDGIAKAVVAQIIPTIAKEETDVMATLADIQAAANSLVDAVENQAIPLLNQLAAGTPVDPAAAQAVVDALTKGHTDLTAAVTADTPVPPAP